MVLACEKKNENGSVDAEILSIPLAQRQNCICCAYQAQVVGADHQDDPGLHVAEVSQATNQPPRTATRVQALGSLGAKENSGGQQHAKLTHLLEIFSIAAPVRYAKVSG